MSKTKVPMSVIPFTIGDNTIYDIDLSITYFIDIFKTGSDIKTSLPKGKTQTILCNLSPYIDAFFTPFKSRRSRNVN